MLKKDELADPNSCLNKSAADEPIFVLRAQDILASDIILKWADMYRRLHAPAGAWKSERHRLKHNEALDIVDKFERWRERRIPD
jgi:hypothetical protein